MVFEIYRGKDKQYFFRLVDENGDSLMLSEGYMGKEKIFEAIDSVKRNVTLPTGISKDETLDGDYYFMVIGADGRMVCKSTMFYSPANRDKWVNDLQRIIPQLGVVEV